MRAIVRVILHKKKKQRPPFLLFFFFFIRNKQKARSFGKLLPTSKREIASVSIFPLVFHAYIASCCCCCCCSNNLVDARVLSLFRFASKISLSLKMLLSLTFFFFFFKSDNLLQKSSFLVVFVLCHCENFVLL